MITGTILNPLDSTGLIQYLPRCEGACWHNENCYVYGVPNFRTRHRTEEQLPIFLEKNKPAPDPAKFNIFLFHMALDIPNATPPQMEAEAISRLKAIEQIIAVTHSEAFAEKAEHVIRSEKEVDVSKVTMER